MIAPFVPKDDEITESWFYDLWVDDGYCDYMNINAFTKEGMQLVAEMNDITLDDDFFKKGSLQDQYIALAFLVHKKGNFKNAHSAMIEGMHRESAWVHALFAARFDPDGIIVPNTLTVQDYKEAGFDVVNENLSDDVFQKKIRERFFDGNDTNVNTITLKIFYANQKGLDCSFLSDAFRRVSKLHSDSKKDSNTICPWQTLGVRAEQFVNGFIYDNIVYRPNFKRFTYPKHVFETDQNVEDRQSTYGVSKEDAVKVMYPSCDILETTEFENYVGNPYSKACEEAVLKLLETTPIDGAHHIIQNRDEIEGLETNQSAPKKLSYPFLPSYISMAQDTGKKFDHEAIMNPMMANNLVHFPFVFTVLWEAVRGESRDDTIKSDRRKKTIDYYLRFHNDPDENKTNLQLHGAYRQLYNLSQAKHLYESDAVIVGAAHIICQMWNAVVCVELEPVLKEKNDKRLSAKEKAATLLKKTFTQIGENKKCEKASDVVTILGK